MPKVKNASVNRQLESQVVALKKQLDACRKEMANIQANRAQELQQAADIGYEMGCLEAEEREISRAKVVAEAIARFEQKYAKEVGRTSVLERADKAVSTKKSVLKAKAKAKARPIKTVVAKPIKPASKPTDVIRQQKKPVKPAPMQIPKVAEVTDVVARTNESTSDII